MAGREQVVICIDNSEWMRNGDFTPTRNEAQLDAANMICGAKTQQHPETTLGVLTMAGKAPNVQVALTSDLGKLLAVLSSIPIGGVVQLSTSLRIAKLVLKKRSSEQGSSLRRIVLFIGSPIRENVEELQELGTELQKSSIALDVINFVEDVANQEKLEALTAAVGSDTAHLITVPAGPHILSDVVMRSPIVLGEAGSTTAGAGGSGGGVGGDAGGFELGVDPNLDPELALAIRLSLEDERRRQEAANAAGGGAATPAAGTSAAPAATTAPSADEDIDMDEDAMLQEALRLSTMQPQASPATPATKPATTTPAAPAKPAASSASDAMVDDDDEELRLALELSKNQPAQKQESAADILQDEDYLNSVIGSLGSDVNADEVLKKQREEQGKKDKQ